MPEKLLDLLGAWEEYMDIYADFEIEPVTAYRKGVRQIVRVVSASKLVVVREGKIIKILNRL